MNKKSVFSDQQRILRLYSELIAKRHLTINDISDMFFVSSKTVQRDIKTIREFLSNLQADEKIKSEIIYDRLSKSYRLTNIDHLFLVFDKVNGLFDDDIDNIYYYQQPNK